ncbi:MAG: alpha/beta fold hydrolase [Candidatus Hodarchaeales archaeon]
MVDSYLNKYNGKQVDIAPFKELYPFKSNWITINGLNYHYLDEGPRKAPALIMVHGNPTWSFYYRKLISEFSDKYRVIVPDHIGCGLSDKPQKYEYTIDQHIENLENLLEHLNIEDPVTMVMHDWGGGIGMGYATRHPIKISKFVIFNTAAFMLSSIPKSIRICRSNRFGGFLVRRLNIFLQGALRFGTSRRKQFTKAVKAGYLAPYNSWKNRIAIHRFVQEIPLEKNHPTRDIIDNVESGLSQFKNHPMIIIWGADDFTFSEKDVLPEWKNRFPDAEINIIKDAGHFIVEDAPEEIIPLMDEFLKNHI